jgi:hypothetical protein
MRFTICNVCMCVELQMNQLPTMQLTHILCKTMSKMLQLKDNKWQVKGSFINFKSSNLSKAMSTNENDHTSPPFTQVQHL